MNYCSDTELRHKFVLDGAYKGSRRGSKEILYVNVVLTVWSPAQWELSIPSAVHCLWRVFSPSPQSLLHLVQLPHADHCAQSSAPVQYCVSCTFTLFKEHRKSYLYVVRHCENTIFRITVTDAQLGSFVYLIASLTFIAIHATSCPLLHTLSTWCRTVRPWSPIRPRYAWRILTLPDFHSFTLKTVSFK